MPTNRSKQSNEAPSETGRRLRLLSAYYESGKLNVYSNEEIDVYKRQMLGSLNNEQLAQLRKVLDYTFRNIVVTE